MKTSQSLSNPAAAAKPSHVCGLPECTYPAPLQCSRYKETHYCSKEHQTAHWKRHKKICVAPEKKPAPPAPLLLKALIFSPFTFRSVHVSLCRRMGFLWNSVPRIDGSRFKDLETFGFGGIETSSLDGVADFRSVAEIDGCFDVL
ncbi:hypothetical protein TrLO_g4892 [Triparma laevis f. longispina]|uniref:MYND-type domain-containing protein n=1 Tax=Triparma laevis f. longispina TaxID=1714387 RepID=A0A9W7FLS9_9STRA|nr:hypothetical protein TrLO_g4892 [Triparma laevis f. longispina]